MDDGRLDPLGLLDDLYKNEKAVSILNRNSLQNLMCHFSGKAFVRGEILLRVSEKGFKARTLWKAFFFPQFSQLFPLKYLIISQIIPFPESTAVLLIQAGEDDHNYESAHFAREAERMLRSSDKTNYRSVVYPGMGHLCQVPFSPGTFDSMHPLAPPGIRWGTIACFNIFFIFCGCGVCARFIKCQKCIFVGRQLDWGAVGIIAASNVWIWI